LDDNRVSARNHRVRASNVQQYAQLRRWTDLTDQSANGSNRAVVRIVIGVLIAMLAIYGAAHIQPSDDGAALASGAFGILSAVLSLYLIGSGIKSRPSSGACGFRHSDTVNKNTR
jgi:hypothetical protein